MTASKSQYREKRKDGKFFYSKKDEGDIRSNIMCEPSLNLDKKKKTAIKVYF